MVIERSLKRTDEWCEVMMRSIRVLLIVGVFLMSYGAASPAEPGADQQFESLAQSYLGQLLELDPEYATALGDHRYDDRLTDRGVLQVERERRFNQRYLKALQAIPADRLNRVNNVDYRILQTHLQAALF